ncbi:MAG: acyltransferase [Deltaproteobacteria bacterium]|nr:acyltransferase [Deltaproteobacteria bacterium]
MDFKNRVLAALEVPGNQFHPLVFILGQPEIGDRTYIGLFSEINANKALVKIGQDCDIASFVSINCADSHMFTLGLATEVTRRDIIVGDHVFIGSHSFIGGYVHIGHHTVVAAGTILINKGFIPPYSLVAGNPAVIKDGYYLAHPPQQTLP